MDIQSKIKSLLKTYGASEMEIKNFMEDLGDFKEESEEDEFDYYGTETMEKLRLTEDGKDLIMNAPTMAKEELEKAIKKYLEEHKDDSN